jgi:hypothetical protein
MISQLKRSSTQLYLKNLTKHRLKEKKLPYSNMVEEGFPTKKEYDAIVSEKLKGEQIRLNKELEFVKKEAMGCLKSFLKSGKSGFTISSCSDDRIYPKAAEYLIMEMKSRGYQPEYDAKTHTLYW